MARPTPEANWEAKWEAKWEANWEANWEAKWEANWEAKWEGNWEVNFPQQLFLIFPFFHRLSLSPVNPGSSINHARSSLKQL